MWMMGYLLDVQLGEMRFSRSALILTAEYTFKIFVNFVKADGHNKPNQAN